MDEIACDKQRHRKFKQGFLRRKSYAAGKVAPTGRVIGIDLATEMLAQASQKVAA